MSLIRFLAEGVGSWLNFEGACDRADMFSEKYLSFPVGQILSARAGSHVVAEYTHPVLAPLKSGPGRPPEVDFVVFGDNRNIKYAIESKWTGKNPISIKRIIWDIIRLEMIANQENAECIFLLGGTRRNLEKLFETEQFSGRKSAWAPKHSLLNTTSTGKHKVILAPTIPHRRPILKDIFKDYQEISFPNHINIYKSGPYPTTCPLNRAQIYAWKVEKRDSGNCFFPKNSRHYVAPDTSI